MRVAEHSAEPIPTPNLARDGSPAPPQTAAGQRGNPWDFIVYVEKGLNEHNWGSFRAYMPPGWSAKLFRPPQRNVRVYPARHGERSKTIHFIEKHVLPAIFHSRDLQRVFSTLERTYAVRLD